MKKTFNLLSRTLLFASMLVSAGVYAQNKATNGFVLKGNITGAADGAKVRLVDVNALKILDSAITNNGAFILKGHVNEPTACWIQCNGEYAIVQVENTAMTLASPLKEMKLNYIAQGGREQTLQNGLNGLLRDYESIYTHAYDSLKKKLYSDTLHKARLIKAFNTAQDTYMNIYVAYGRKHVDSYLGLDIVYSNRKSIPKDSLMLLYNSLPPILKNTDKAQSLKTYATETLAQKGGHFLDFEARTIQGRPFKLSDLKGRYIYLAFGSLSCGPCRMENQEIAKKYSTLYKQVDIVNFSLDVNHKEWEAAAKVDGIVWYNVSDMMGMAGKIKTLYNVQGMPTSFLIDPSGVIIERFDGYSDENITKIAKIVSEGK